MYYYLRTASTTITTATWKKLTVHLALTVLYSIHSIWLSLGGGLHVHVYISPAQPWRRRILRHKILSNFKIWAVGGCVIQTSENTVRSYCILCILIRSFYYICASVNSDQRVKNHDFLLFHKVPSSSFNSPCLSSLLEKWNLYGLLRAP